MANETADFEDEDDASVQEQAVSAMNRAAAGASALTNQQLRKARARVDDQIAAQRAHVTGRVRTLGRALRGAGEMLEEDDVVAQCLHFASDKVESVAGYVAELNPTDASEDLRSFARERPAWFFGGAFVLGLALGRFARSTAEAAASERATSPRKRRVATQNSARSGGAGAQQPASRARVAKS